LVADKKIENSATKEVLSYKEALWLGLEQLKKKPYTTTNLCICIVQCIKQNTASIRESIPTPKKCQTVLPMMSIPSSNSVMVV
jgi:hypothetical protein